MSDMILLNGIVRTMDPELPVAEAVVIEGNRVTMVGSNPAAQKRAGCRSLCIDLEGRTVLPGLNDCHLHPVSYGRQLASVTLTSPPNESVADIMARVAEWVAKTPAGEWIRGSGYDDTKLRERRHPTRDDLDRVAPDNPVYLSRACGHLGVANSAALRIAGIDRETPDPRGGHIYRDRKGRPTGILAETAQSLVRKHIPELTSQGVRQVLRDVGREMARRGITSVWDAGVGSGETIRAYRELQASGDFPVRVNLAIGSNLLDGLETLGLPPGFGDDWLRITAVKLVLDGSISGHTAALHDPFSGGDDRGLIYMPQNELNSLVLRVHNLGLQVGIHAIGDRAIDSALDAIENAQRRGKTERRDARVFSMDTPVSGMLPDAAPVYRRSPRHRIEHCSLTSPERIARLRRLGVLPIPQPIFIYGEGHSYLEYLGEGRAQQAYTLRSYIDNGIPTPLSTDCPATSWYEPLNPFLNMAMAVSRTTQGGQSLGEAETISAEEALRAYTLHSAFASFDEGQKGALKPGYLADLVVLDSDPVGVLPEGFDSIGVEMTIVDGELVYQAE